MIPRLILSLVLLTASGVAIAQVNALPPTRHILVYGDAQARAIPDRFKITLDFSALDHDAGAARRRVEDSLAGAVRRLRDVGVPDAEIVATSLAIAPERRYDEAQRTQVFAGTRVRRSLSARFAGKADVEAFLSGLQTSQELAVSQIETELADERTLRAALRTGAIDSTREKAATLARGYGARLGALYSVSDVAPQFEYGIREGNWPALYEWNPRTRALDRIVVTGSRVSAPAAAPQTALQTGYVTYTDRIYAVFLLAD
ncbi:SIMPL domain-containing protein [Lysobacter humi (ex Lee et al. 2017)]